MSWDDEDAGWEDMEDALDVVGEGGGGGVEDEEDLGPEEAVKEGEGVGAAAVAVVLGAGTDDTNYAKKKKAEKEAKRAAKEARDREAALARRRAAEEAAKVLDDPVAEKLRQRKLVEDADHALTDELFDTSGAAPAAPAEETAEDTVARLSLTDEASYTALAQAVAGKLIAGGSAPMTLAFCQALIRAVGEGKVGGTVISKGSGRNAGEVPLLSADDFTQLTKTANSIKNDKVKAMKAKPKKGKKKYTGKQGFASVESQDDWMSGGGRGGGAEYDDFM